jgi:hypothetical protein
MLVSFGNLKESPAYVSKVETYTLKIEAVGSPETLLRTQSANIDSHTSHCLCHDYVGRWT